MATTKKIISRRFSMVHVNKYAPTVQPVQIPYIQQVKQKLTSGAYKVSLDNCPCGATGDEVIVAEIDRYGLPLTSVLCLACGTVRTDPYLDETSIAHFYTNYYQKMYNRSSDAEAYFERQKQYGTKFLSLCKSILRKESWIFEVGCGAGGALKVFQENNFLVAGCDYDKPLLEFGSRKGVNNLVYGSLLDLEKNLPQVKADVIFMNHVFEHVTNPEELLKLCKKMLSSQGRILLSVPELIDVDKFEYFGGDLLPMFHIAHKYNYTFEGLECLGARLNLTLKRLTPDASIKTATSGMPELWVEMKIAHTPIEGKKNIGTGQKVLQRLNYLEGFYKKRLRKEKLKNIIKRLSELTK